MNRLTKRGLSLLLALVMCVSLLSGLSFVTNAAVVEYVTGSYEDYTNIIYNWGTRGVTATFLSPNAEDYYEAKGTSYEELAALAGSTDTDATDSALYAELKDIMTEGMENTNYGDVRYLFPFTDCQNSNTSYISSFYDGVKYSNVWDGQTYNREHVWADSKLTKNDPSASTRADSTDLMLLRPVTSSINSSHGNKAHGVSDGYFNPSNYVGTSGYDVRGDVARTLLYVYVRWDSAENMWGKDGVIESIEILFDWMEADPVDTWEMGRNDSVESITNTRNVFVDYPELAYQLFTQEMPEDMATPSTGTSYDVTAVSANNAQGTVKVAGNVINVYPAEGYEMADYRVTSGKAEVVAQGDLLIVNATSDCVVTVSFKARGNSTVTFMANGQLVDTMTACTGDAIVLPDGTLAVMEGYEFAGWVAEQILDEVNEAPVFYPAGAQYTVDADITLYALFIRTGEGSGEGAVSNYTLLTGAVTSGDYIITHDKVAIGNSAKSNKLLGVTVTPSNGVINNPDSNIIWTVTVTGTTATIANKANGKFLQTAASGTNLTMNTSEAIWNVIENGDGTYDFQNSKATTRCIRYNAQYNYFGSYVATSNGAPLKLYKATSAVSYYTTGAEAVLTPEEEKIVEYWNNGELVGSYATFEDALAAVNNGTLVLLADVEANSVIVKPGVMLDLNGYTLTTDLLIAMNGAIVTDGGADCIGGGSLKIAKANLVLAQDNGGVIPVWNGADGYVFTKVSYQQLARTAGEGAAQYIFLPAFSNADAATLLANGGADNGVHVKVGLNWNDGQCQQFYTYQDTLVEQVFSSGGKLVFSLTITGIAGITDMTASAVLVTDSGAHGVAAGTAIVAG